MIIVRHGGRPPACKMLPFAIYERRTSLAPVACAATRELAAAIADALAKINNDTDRPVIFDDALND